MQEEEKTSKGLSDTNKKPVSESTLSHGQTKSTSVERQMYRKSFGVWLRQQRITAKLTRETAALMAGLTATHWAKIESGSTGTRLTTIARLANAVSADLQEAYKQYGRPDWNLASHLPGVVYKEAKYLQDSLMTTQLQQIARGIEKAIWRLTRELALVNQLIAHEKTLRKPHSG